MLFLVIEHFRGKNAAAIGQRFADCGRMLPEGLAYHASWVDPIEMRCYQIMEADRKALVTEWCRRWEDLVEFEVITVVTSANFWDSQAER
jgi:hypothetical protein